MFKKLLVLNSGVSLVEEINILLKEVVVLMGLAYSSFIVLDNSF